MAEIEVQKTLDQEALEKIIEIKRTSKEQIKKVKKELKQQKLEQKNKGKVVPLSKAATFPHRFLVPSRCWNKNSAPLRDNNGALSSKRHLSFRLLTHPFSSNF